MPTPGSPNASDSVLYGDAVVLVDRNNKSWNINADTFFSGYLRPLPHPQRGELHLSFQPCDDGQLGQPMYFGDSGVSLDVENDVPYNKRVTLYKKASSSVQGGYIMSSGHGMATTFSILPGTSTSDCISIDTVRSLHEQKAQGKPQAETGEVLHYGDKIRLLSTLPNGGGGFVGLNTGTNRVAVAHTHERDFEAQRFTLCRSPFSMGTEHKTAVCYGDALLLVDEAGLVWNNSVVPVGENGLLSLSVRASAGTKVRGEMHVSLTPASLSKVGKPIRLGDRDLYIDVVRSQRVRNSFNKRLSHTYMDCKPGFNGSIVRCDGRGTPLSFTVRDSGINVIPHPVANSATLQLRESDNKGVVSGCGHLLKNILMPLFFLGIAVFSLMRSGTVLKEDQIFQGGEQAHFENLVMISSYALMGTVSVILFHLSGGCSRVFDFRVSSKSAQSTEVGASLPSESASASHSDETERKEREEKEEVSVDKYRWETPEGELKPTPWDELEDRKMRADEVIVHSELAGKTDWKDDGSDVPTRFINAEKGDVEAGRARFVYTSNWRAQWDMETMLEKPHPHFDFIKANSAQFYHGRTKDGQHAVYYERLMGSDMDTMRKHLELEDIIYHFLYVCEYCWHPTKGISPANEEDMATSITVFDVEGCSMSMYGGDILKYVRATTAFCGKHYPERSYRLFFINVPFWFDVVWKMCKLMVDPVTLSKVEVCRGSVTPFLSKYVHMKDIPVRYGGDCTCGGTKKHPLCESNHPDEVALRRLVAETHKNMGLGYHYPSTAQAKKRVAMVENRREALATKYADYI